MLSPLASGDKPQVSSRFLYHPRGYLGTRAGYFRHGQAAGVVRGVAHKYP